MLLSSPLNQQIAGGTQIDPILYSKRLFCQLEQDRLSDSSDSENKENINTYQSKRMKTKEEQGQVKSINIKALKGKFVNVKDN